MKESIDGVERGNEASEKQNKITSYASCTLLRDESCYLLLNSLTGSLFLAPTQVSKSKIIKAL